MMELSPPRVFCIGTHHKTGTVWMSKVFRKLAKHLGIPFYNQRKHMRSNLDWLPDTGRVIVVNWFSAFSDSLLDRPDARILHLIRDPRDVLISGLHYHARTQSERFLHKPRADLDGLTYQQHLQSLPDLKSQFLFEMEEKHATTLQGMRNWRYDRPNGIEWRYEDIIEDKSCGMFIAAMRAFGLSDAEVESAQKIFWQESLFGGLASQQKAANTHVRSARVQQWRTELPPEIAEIYLDRHGDDLIALGYETDKNWLDQIDYQPTKMIA